MTGRRVATSTQVEHPWKAVLRTVLQMVLGLAVSAPLIVEAITGGDPEAAGGALAVFLTVAAAITRVMAVPLVNGWLSVIGLGAAPRPKAAIPGELAADDPNLTAEYHETTRDA